jgi:hypothetical protein
MYARLAVESLEGRYAPSGIPSGYQMTLKCIERPNHEFVFSGQVTNPAVSNLAGLTVNFGGLESLSR